jgi:hypothetical protein
MTGPINGNDVPSDQPEGVNGGYTPEDLAADIEAY